jgi:uncharacterized circularly permuted ATP-grasp superfamily protein
VGDLFDGYPVNAGAAFDEVFAPSGDPRPVYRRLLDAIRPLTSDDLGLRRAALDRAFRDQGITFSLFGEERPFPLDLVPRLIAAADWQVVEQGVAQRVRALEAFLADVYGAQEIFDAGIVPRRLVLSSAHFHRAASGIEPPNGVRVHVAGVDLVRDEEGAWRVLEDNVRVPSGVSYVVENRRAMTRVFPELFATYRVQPVEAYASQLLRALRCAAPHGVVDPTVVVLTPGVHNSAYFEHTLLARLMGVELVEGRDLIVRGARVWMRTTGGEQPVHVIYRRVDDEFLDPMQFRPDSMVGCAGLLGAARAGNVTLANAVGNGVADDKLLYTYVPDLIRYYLAEEPVLQNVETYRLEEPDVCSWVLEHLAELVIKPVDGSGGKGIVIGPQADEESLDRLRDQVSAAPRGWVAQRLVNLSTSPTFTDAGVLPRHVDLRPFAVNDGERVWVLPGGLTRVALPEGGLVVNSSQGGGSKDTWVLAEGLQRQRIVTAPRTKGAVRGEQRDTGPATLMEQAQQQQQARSSC